MNQTAKLFQIAIFKCCAAPLDKLDLSFLNIKFYALSDLEGHIKSVAGESALKEYKTVDSGQCYPLVPEQPFPPVPRPLTVMQRA